jgi:hypothetical protein
MANVLTDILTDIYIANEKISKQIVGILPSSTINGGSEAVALGGTISSARTADPTVSTIVPSMTIPEGNDYTVTKDSFTLTQTASVQIPVLGEDQKLMDAGAGYNTVYGAIIERSIKKMVDQIETYAYNKARIGSRALGIAGTAPFASNYNVINDLRNELFFVNGAPDDQQTSLILGGTGSTALRNLAQLQQANTSGDTSLLRQGTLLPLSGVMIKESLAIGNVVKGTGASYTTTTAGFAVGTTVIPLITGSGTVLAGDVVTFAGDSNKYIVKTGIAAPGSITISAPGLRQSIAASAVAMTVGNDATRNILMHKSALEVAVRPMAQPAGGDASTMSTVIVDPRSGIGFTVAHYAGFHKAMVNISCVYDAKLWYPEYAAVLLG